MKGEGLPCHDRENNTPWLVVCSRAWCVGGRGGGDLLHDACTMMEQRTARACVLAACHDSRGSGTCTLARFPCPFTAEGFLLRFL